ncbi:MAG: FAD-dependent monooxygenase [Proteobacteria bacterium]|nr:FAD-dependent monooxygenase [Pseudomonadota bacterium]
MKVIIVGAGIGGSTLALSLAHLGIDYTLIEQAPAFTTVGAGIQLSPNGVRVLDQLGLGEKLKLFCSEPDFHKYSVWDTGETVLKTPLQPMVKATYGHAYYHAHRADLIDLLTAPLDSSRLLMNTRVAAVEQNETSAWVTTTDGDRIEGDVIIGADGIHSLVREQVFKPDSPRESGYASWRGVIDSDAIAHLDIPASAYVDMGPRLSFVYYFVSGGKRFNWLALGRTNDPLRESWSQTATREEVIAAFDGWYDRPKQIIEATPTIFVTALHDREPLASWVSGRIALMGDAAHTMLPYHAQGAVQSLEDAWVLARTLELRGDSPLAALKHYESLRYQRANMLVQQSRSAEGWYHVDTPEQIESRNERFRSTSARLDGGFSPQQHWLYSYDADRAALGTDDEWRALRAWS